MHATLHGSGQMSAEAPIRGIFYPGDGPTMPARTASSIVPKLVAVLAAVLVVRAAKAARRHAGPGRHGGRRAAIARLHRELHEQGAAEAGGSAGEAVSA